jgi:hypothetical protein
MRPSLKNLSTKAHDAAAGSALPAGQEPVADDTGAPVPTTAERGSMRKRARRLTRLREVQLRELGALVVEMRRLGRENPELLARKAADLLVLDEELRGLRAALGERETLEQVVAAGVAGTCRRCDTLMGSDDRFCPHCGLGVDEVYPAPVVEPPAAAAGAGVSAEAVPGPEAAAPAPPPEAGASPAQEAAPAPPPPNAPAPPPSPEAAAPPARPEAAGAPPPPPPPPPAAPEAKDGAEPKDRGQTELTATAPPQP